LRIPVNQQTVSQIGTSDEDGNAFYSDIGIYLAPNEFMPQESDPSAIYGQCDYANPNDFDNISKLKVRALYDYQAQRQDELTFTKRSIIQNVNKQDGGWWRGDYGDKRQGWFPANFVEEIDDSDSEGSPLGAMQKGTMDLTGCSLDRILGGKGNQPFIFRIFSSQSVVLEIASPTEDLLLEWMKCIRNCTNMVASKAQQDKQWERNMRIAKEFSDLIVYCRTAPFDPDRIPGPYYEMSSFPETKVEKWASRTKAELLVKYNRLQLSRVYPKGSRIESSNYDPMPYWVCGSQLLALNYQTPDRAMQLNQGLFKQNGGRGYVLQPECMRHDIYHPFHRPTVSKIVEPITISLIIIGARHLTKTKRISSPYVEVEIVGNEYDNQKFKTEPCQDNGFNPIWNVPCDFDISNPDVALIRFVVQDEDMFSDPNFLGQATFPVGALKTGLRSVPLLNGYSEELELASLLVLIEIKNSQEEGDEIYASIIQLRDHCSVLQNEIAEKEQRGDSLLLDSKRQELQMTEQKLFAKTEERRRTRRIDGIQPR